MLHSERTRKRGKKELNTKVENHNLPLYKAHEPLGKSS
jgi:hypothetical protein